MFGAVFAVSSFLSASDDGEGVENVGSILTRDSIRKKVERVELTA